MEKTMIQQRVNDLKKEFESGQQMLAEIEAKRSEMTNTLIRISGAIQVLEEVLAEEDSVDSNVTEIHREDVKEA